MEADGGDDQVLDISAGSSHSVALINDDIVVSWGRGEDGQLGHGNADEVTVPKVVNWLRNAGVSAIICGAEYTVAVSKGRNEVYSWGWGDFGRLGHGNGNDVFLPQPITFFSGILIKQVACGDTHTLVVNDAGELYSFGRNQNGQLGLGHTNDSLGPQLVDALRGQAVTSVACGSEHSVVATQSGQAYSWGWGRYGNLGDGHCQDRHLPTLVHGLSDVRVATVRCGWRHSAATTHDGRIFTFGWSKFGQLGHGDNSDRLVATPVTGLSGVTIVGMAGGWRHTLAVDAEGKLYAWGWNKFGQLGLGDLEDRNAPVLVAGLAAHRVAKLACGWRHTLAVSGAGVVFSWGRGVNGQLGHGREEDLSIPTMLKCLSKGHFNRAAILSTDCSNASGYVAPEDRYAVVPDSQGSVPPGAGGAPPMVPSVPAAAATASAAAASCGLGFEGRTTKKPRVEAVETDGVVPF